MLAEQVDDVLMRSDYCFTTPAGALEVMELARELADAGNLHLAALAATVACDDVTSVDKLFFRFVIDDLGEASWPSRNSTWSRWRTVALDRDRSAWREDNSRLNGSSPPSRTCRTHARGVGVTRPSPQRPALATL